MKPTIRFFCAALCLLLSILLPLGAFAALKCDLNGDGSADISDVTALLDMLSSGQKEARADLNGDGAIDISDVTSLLDKLSDGSANVEEGGGEEDEDLPLSYAWNDEDQSYTVTGIGDFSGNELTVPSKHLGKPVGAIGDYAFFDVGTLTSVRIPGSVKHIGDGAFYAYSSSITEITFGEGLVSIGESAFGRCGVITLKLPDSLETVGEYAFQGCYSLTTLVLPKNAEIGKYAFSSCRALTSVTIPEGVKKIPESMFSSCDLLEEITLPESLTEIGKNAFNSCPLASVRIPKNVETIGEGAFSYGAYETIAVDPANAIYAAAGNCLIEKASKRLIAGCKNSVIPSDGSVTAIGEEAFGGVTGLEAAVIPEGVVSVGAYAFSGCRDLKSVFFPASAAEIKEGVLSSCVNLETISVADGNACYTASGNCLIDRDGKTLIAGCKNSVIPADGSVEVIGDSAFQLVTGLASVVIPDSVKKIGIYAFIRSDIQSLTLGAGVEEIGMGAFNSCSGLTSLVIGTNVKSIGDFAFNTANLDTICYRGTEEQWNEIVFGNRPFKSTATFVYNYSED